MATVYLPQTRCMTSVILVGWHDDDCAANTGPYRQLGVHEDSRVRAVVGDIAPFPDHPWDMPSQYRDSGSESGQSEVEAMFAAGTLFSGLLMPVMEPE
jgi:hypothetical protein